MNGKNNRLAVTLLAVVVSVALVIFGFRPALDRYHGHRVALAAAAEEQTNLEAAKTQILRLGQEMNAHAADANRLGLAVPTDAQIPELVSQMAGLAQSAGVQLLTIQPNQPKAGSDLIVTVTVQGNFLAIVGLAERLEQNLRPAAVQTINIVKAASTGDTLTATVKVSFAQTSAGAGGH